MACGQLLFGGDEPDAGDQVDEALAAFGLVAEASLALDDEFWLWPENEAVFGLWLAVQSQWNIADGARHGLDYSGVQVVMEMRGIQRREQQHQFALLQVMESACLTEWARNRK